VQLVTSGLFREIINMSQTARYVRNGAWAGIGFYTITAVTLLTLSMSYDRVPHTAVGREIPVALVERIGHVLPVVLHG
jgi:hypothetical protein